MKGTISILAAVLLFGCTEQKQSQDRTKPLVFVSIPPQAGLVKAIAGDLVEVRTLIGEGQSPHSYEPTAHQLIALNETDAFFMIGIPFEKHILKKMDSLYLGPPIVQTQNNIELRTMPHSHHDEHSTHAHGENDPHVWLSPTNAQIIATSIFQTLGKIDSKNITLYTQRYQQLMEELQQLDSEISTKLAPYKGSRIYVFHPSFGYFTDAYGLKQVSIELDGKSPTPHQLAELIEQAKNDGVKVVFVQKQFPASSAKVIADALGGTVVQLDPLAEDVVANLKKIANSIDLALEQ